MLRISAALFLCLIAPAHADDPVQTDPDKYKIVFENEKGRVLQYHDEPGDQTHEHHHPAFVQ